MTTAPIRIGLDLSLTSTGWAIEKGGNIMTGVLTIQKGLDGVERLSALRAALGRVLDVASPNGEWFSICIEDYAFSATGRAFGIGEWGGVARLAVSERPNVDIYTTAPTTLKKFVSGSGVAKKELMMLKIYQRWGFSASNNDEADAFALLKLMESDTETFPVKLLYSRRTALKVPSPTRFS